MNIRLATVHDIPGILALQDRNLVSKLSVEQKKDGFVTTPFTSELLAQLIELSGISVIELDQRIAGYAMAGGWDYFQQWPMFPFMIGRFQKLAYRGIPITRANSFQYGPVCVDHALRGSPAFPALFAFSRSSMANRFPVGTTFINQINSRSFAAHTRKTGLEVIDEFDWNNNRYWGLAFLTRA